MAITRERLTAIYSKLFRLANSLPIMLFQIYMLDGNQAMTEHVDGSLALLQDDVTDSAEGAQCNSLGQGPRSQYKIHPKR